MTPADLEAEEVSGPQLISDAWKKFHGGYFEEALRLFSKALKADSTLIAGWEGQVRCLVELDEYREAETWLNKALGLYPKNAGLLSVKALVGALAGRFEEAMGASDQALSIKTDDSPFFWIDRGCVLILSGNTDTARMNFAKVLEGKGPDLWQWQLRAGVIYLKAGKATLALDLLKKASDNFPGNPYIWYKTGLACIAVKNQPRARDAFEKALEIDPHYKPASTALKSLKEKACFVATCLDIDDTRLCALRAFRNRIRKRAGGEQIWQLYLRISPPVVDFLQRIPAVKPTIAWIMSRCADAVKEERK